MSKLLQKDELEKYAELRALIDGWKTLGEKTYPDGTRWIAHTPHCAPEAYLHHVFGPLEEEAIQTLQYTLEWDFPRNLKGFFQLHNGMSLFCSYLNVYGLRKSWSRTNALEFAQQPYSITDDNIEARPMGAPDNILFVGSLGNRRDLVGMLPTGKILVFNERTGAIQGNSHPGIFDFLLYETRKARILFDDLGRRLDGSDILPELTAFKA